MPKILIIDDDPDIVDSCRLFLERKGFDVAGAASRDAGMKAVDSYKPDLLILDVMMDTTTAGFQFALALRSPDPASPLAAYRQVPILMITALHRTTDLRFGPDAEYLPVDAFVDKPVDPDKLIEKVNELLKQ